MEKLILQYAPKTWEKIDNSNPVRRIFLPTDSLEYELIHTEVQKALGRPVFDLQVERFQNSFDYGQYLIREQSIVNLYVNEQFYRVRRFIRIERRFLQVALANNLDYRRCGLPKLCFQKHLGPHKADEIILVVQVLTKTPDSKKITPQSSSDYYIEYIVNM